ncbi:hypothetical protein [Kitasatospora sp. NPDC089509]|uniref:hypothetical protein n=1 Tax=Kitasatospora sp. NPDC089509 TaxID=3364079 RepID=UPI0038271E29
MIKRVIVGAAAAALFGLGTGAAFAADGPSVPSAPPGTGASADGWKGDANDAAVRPAPSGGATRAQAAAFPWEGDVHGA